jgi:hypothetical protein
MDAMPMPDLSRGRHGFRHTLDSALDVLFALGISPARITVQMAGSGWPTDAVIGQEPPAGMPLTADRTIALSVAGSGVFFDLPAGMWDKGGEREFGTDELVNLFDDPLQKMAHWIRDGARLFDIRKDRPDDCARWLRLFGITADAWPSEFHYELALLLPSLHRLAGRENGMGFIFSTLLKLPLLEIRRRPHTVHLARHRQSRLGERQSRLGLDLVASDRRNDLSGWRLVFGPVTLFTYCQYRDPYYEKLLRATVELAVPCYQPVEIAWSVLDVHQAPRLGYPRQNGVLGVNTHLGMTTPMKALS